MRVFAPKPEPVRQPRAHGEHVLHRAADFDADDVGGGVRAKVVGRQALRQRMREARIRRGHRHRGGQARAHFLRERRPRQHGHRPLGAQHFARHLVRQLAGVELEALRRPGDARCLIQARRDLLQQRAKRMAGHGDQHVQRSRAAPRADPLDTVSDSGKLAPGR